MKCPECGYENREEARFCLECGAKLENVCPQCGARLPPGAKFCDDCGARLPEAPSATPPRLEDMQKQLQDRIPQSLADKLFAGAKQMQGEYRLVTALFADVSGSSGMARELPLEQYVETMNDCFKMMVDTISIKYEGSINRFIGDCVLAFFGAPITHENDAERAILAALDIREAVKALGLDVSIGINTGMTYVGEMGSDLTYSERSAWGPDVDFARRLQEAAGPGQIWVGASTYRLTRRAFDFSRTVEIEAKGTTGTAYPVLHVKEHPEKLRGIEGLRARMIGREREFSDLKEAADGLISGRGSIVTIIGEAGLGKSRLAWELKEYLDKRLETSDMRQEDDDAASLKSDVSGLKSHVSGLVSILEGRSISIGQTVSYWPFLDILRTYLDLRDTDTESDIARKLREAVTDLFPQGWEDVLPFMGRLLSINLGDDMERKLSYYTPEQIRHQTLMRMRGVLTAISRRKPLLLILEDMHWSDDLSMDLVSLLMDDLAENPLMLLCIYRPERGHRCWQLGDIASRKCLERYTEITLKKLSSAQSRQLVESLLEIENLPEATREMILRKSEGNPFFIEEVIRYLIDRDLIYREADRWKARREIEDIDVPDTIQSVLLSRVDRLESETRYVLQCASVIGRLFRYRLLEHLSRHERDLEEHLSELEERELVIEERTVPELEYSFKHALTQEATYQSILERRRRQFHQRVAEGIEALYRDRVEDFYEELAHHYARSENPGKTVEYLLKAGEKAKSNYDNEVAISQFSEALEMMKQYQMDRSDWKLEALRGLGQAYLGTGKLAEAEKVFEDAITLAKGMEMTPRHLARLYYWIGEVFFSQSRFDEMLQYGQKGLGILGDDAECMEAALINSLIAVGVAYSQGDYSMVRKHIRRNMEFISNLDYSIELRASYTHNVYFLSNYERSAETAWEWAQELELRAREHGDQGGVAEAFRVKAHILSMKGDCKNSLLLLQRYLELLARMDARKEMAQQDISLTLFALGHIQEAKEMAETFLNSAKEIGSPLRIARAHGYLGHIEMFYRRWPQAVSHYEQGVRLLQEVTRNPLFTSQAYFHLGRAYLRACNHQQAIQCFAQVADAGKEEGIDPETRKYGRLFSSLAGIEEAHIEMGTPEDFAEFCHSFREEHPDILERYSLFQWYLEPAKPSEEFSHPLFMDFGVSPSTQEDSPDRKTADSPWLWLDEFGDCSHRITPEGGLEVSASNGRGLHYVNFSAPRLMQEISGDFAVEVCTSPAANDKPHMGGLLVWKDKDNFMKLERGVDGRHEMRLNGYIDGVYQVVGRGILQAEDEVSLKLERSGDEFSAYCSVDGEQWLTCGMITLPMDDPVQVGIHAIGVIDRTIYCGEYREGTATVFRNFRIWTRS